MNIKILISLYLIIVNLIGFTLMGVDKYKASHHKWRIPEKILFLVAIIGGGVGSYAGMMNFRHKTKHASFMYGIPAIIIVHIAIAGYLSRLF